MYMYMYMYILNQVWALKGRPNNLAIKPTNSPAVRPSLQAQINCHVFFVSFFKFKQFPSHVKVRTKKRRLTIKKITVQTNKTNKQQQKKKKDRN